MLSLGRPDFMDGIGYISSETQCPQKPRGRKPKKEKQAKAADSAAADEGRPSAAACGFSTHNMTDEEVKQKLAKTCGNPKADVCKETVSRKKSRRPRKSDYDDETASAPKDDSNIPKTIRKRSRNPRKSDYDTADTPKDDSIIPKTKKTKAKADKSETATASKIDKHETAAASTVNKKEKSETANTNTVPGTERKSGKKNNKKKTTEEPVDVPTRRFKRLRRSKSSPAPATELETPVDHADDMPEPETPVAPVVTAAEPETDTPVAAELIAAERKAKQSRKSSAYHKARLAAKKEGKSEKEQIAAGKAVSRFIAFKKHFVIAYVCLGLQKHVVKAEPEPRILRFGVSNSRTCHARKAVLWFIVGLGLAHAKCSGQHVCCTTAGTCV